MAVIHVSNWNDFKTAIEVTGDTIILDSDIDASGDIISSTINIRATEIDGQGHTIYNYTSTHSGSDFYNSVSGSTCTIKNLNFYNIVAGGESRTEAFIVARYGAIIVDNCRLQGTINKSLINRGVTMSRCSCTFAKLRYLGGNSNDILNECWFDIGDNALTSNENYFNGTINYCYFKGKINTVGRRDNEAIFNCNCSSSIFNIEFTDSSDGIKTIKLNSRDADSICLYNTDKLSFPAYVVFSAQNKFTGLSDASLKNPVAVNATGFSPFVV